MSLLIDATIAPQNGAVPHRAGAHCAHATALHCESCKVRSLAVCSALDATELRDLDRIARHLVVPAKEPLVDQDGSAQSVFTVTHGCVRLYKLLADGRRQIVGFALPGDFLGLTVDGRYGFSAETVAESTLCQFSRADFDALVTAKPALLRKLHDFATHELVIAQDQMMLLGRRSAEERVAAFLLTLRDRWLKITGHGVTVALPMQRLDIADYLGLTIETVSRIFSRLARDKVILNVPDGVRILNLARLETLAKM